MATEKKVFKIDLADLAPSRKSIDSIFTKIDQSYLGHFHERRDMIRCYRDIPVALTQLYKEPDYIKNRHGNDIQIQIDVQTSASHKNSGHKRRRRQVTVVKDSFSADEEHVF
jgi:hypothetical protein